MLKRSKVIVRRLAVLAGLTLGVINGNVRGAMVITEWEYNGLGTGGLGEFVEFTNTGNTAVDMSTYSFDDSSRAPSSQPLAAYGMVAPGESVLFTDDTEANFRANWSLAPGIKIIGGNANNLGRGDEINLYDGSILVDRLTYDDQTIAGCPRTQGKSASTSPANYGANNAGGWVLASAGDAFGSATALNGEIGNPGIAAIPEPASAALLGMSVVTIMARRKRSC